RASDFYRGEVAAAFNDTPAAEESFKRVLANHPHPAIAKRIHEILGSAALREGRYVLALSETDALLAVDPTDQDAKDTRPLLELLSHYPDEAVEQNGVTTATVQAVEANLPVSINGKTAAYYCDSGANFSLMTVSEAKRCGMEIKDVSGGGQAHDINGNMVSIQIALASSLAVGRIVIHNVAFLVVPDGREPFIDAKPGEAGLIGLPVMLAIGSMKWNQQGKVIVDRSPKPRDIDHANLCLDGLSVIAQASYRNHALPFVLDTGDTSTDLWPKFEQAAQVLIRRSGKVDSYTLSGFAGSEKFDIISIPRLTLLLGGSTVVLAPAHIRKVFKTSATKWFYGNLGVDVLSQYPTLTLDFRTMTLAIGLAQPRHNRMALNRIKHR
ncbi:MAG TPA: aspartyl protease family protein, partial [Blastocatellia bacterium]